MDKLATTDITLEGDLISPAEQHPARRLIVLVSPDGDYTAATPRIWELANATGSSVQLLGLYRDWSEESALRRTLVTMAALIQDTQVSVEIKVQFGRNWVKAVKDQAQTGDMIVCLASQRTNMQGRLSHALESSLKNPIYILQESNWQMPKSKGFSPIITWSGILGILIGFFALQVSVLRLPKDSLQTLLLILLLVPEFWLIWVWNNLTG